MTDLLATARAWLDGQRKAHMASTVTYRRGEDSVELAATKGSTPFRIVGDFGAQTRVVVPDWLVTAADLVLDGAVVEPAAGDEIDQELADGTVLTYEVMSPTKDEPAWRYSGAGRETLRIHTKQTEETPE